MEVISILTMMGNSYLLILWDKADLYYGYDFGTTIYILQFSSHL